MSPEEDAFAQKLAERARHARFLNLAVQHIGECLADIGTLQAQGVRDDNQAKIGGVIIGLERAKQAVAGQPFKPPKSAEETAAETASAVQEATRELTKQIEFLKQGLRNVTLALSYAEAQLIAQHTLEGKETTATSSSPPQSEDQSAPSS
jgi:hypothetical protein